jgi:transposase-like protein
MTTGELATIKNMWEMGLPVKQIAHAVGYSDHHIYRIAIRNRDMFPYRYKPRKTFGEDAKEMWARRVSSGESTVMNAANQCGVSCATIRKWVRRYA